jgi:hypothetical protein
LSAEQQRIVIKEILAKRGELKKGAAINTGALFRASSGSHGERRYLVFAGWWRKWLDFVNFNFE